MRNNTTICSILTTNCTIVNASADLQTIREIFDYFPNQFLPVVDGLRFVGVILRDEFLKKYVSSCDNELSATELISKEMVCLSPKNSLADAKEIFAACTFDVIPVTDADGDLMGILLRSEVEKIKLVANPVTHTLLKIRALLTFQ